MLEMRQGINECQTNPCQHNGKCKDLRKGGYLCHCPPGTTGKNCETDVNECLNNPCLNGVCEDRLNHYQCVCEPGFYGDNCDTQEPCTVPSRWKPYYKLVDGKCYYLEKTPLNYQGAINNCQEKFKNYGGNGILFEPTSVDEFKKVYQAAETFLSLRNFGAWIGIKKSTNGILVYSRTGQPVTFQPPWYGSQSLSDNDGFCVVVYEEKFMANWFHHEKVRSICVNNI